MDDDILFDDKPRYNTAQQVTLKEMARRAQDRIRVFNPLDKDYVVRWDGMGFRVPAKLKDDGQGKGQAVLPRYVAINYAKQMVDKIIGMKVQQAILEENDKRIHSGMGEMNKWQEQAVFESKIVIESTEIRKKLFRIVWLGVEEEYGSDMDTEAAPTQRQRSEDDILAEMDTPARRLTDVSDLDTLLSTTQSEDELKQPPVTQPPSLTNDKKEQLLQEVGL